MFENTLCIQHWQWGLLQAPTEITATQHTTVVEQLVRHCPFYIWEWANTCWQTMPGCYNIIEHNMHRHNTTSCHRVPPTTSRPQLASDSQCTHSTTNSCCVRNKGGVILGLEVLQKWLTNMAGHPMQADEAQADGCLYCDAVGITCKRSRGRLQAMFSYEASLQQWSQCPCEGRLLQIAGCTREVLSEAELNPPETDKNRLTRAGTVGFNLPVVAGLTAGSWAPPQRAHASHQLQMQATNCRYNTKIPCLLPGLQASQMA